MELLVNQIIPFSNVEGAGNRTAVFLQGCDIRCVYCHNPETIPLKSAQAKIYDVDELFKMIKSYKPFIRGITVSGGEPTLQYLAISELFKKVKSLGLSCYIDSNGFFDYEKIEELILHTDKFLYDIKGMGKPLKRLCFSREREFGETRLNRNVKEYTSDSASDSIHFKNLTRLLRQNKVEEVRIVCIKGFHSIEDLVSEVSKTILPYPDVLLKLIRVHIRGSSKSMGSNLKKNIPTQKEMNLFEKIARDIGVVRIEVIL